jgi:hypothetical protein
MVFDFCCAEGTASLCKHLLVAEEQTVMFVRQHLTFYSSVTSTLLQNMFLFDFSFNQLDLPVYETYDKLRIYLLKAIHECSEGFGFA